MSIVHLIWSFSLGGAESMLVDIINQQCSQNKIKLIVINNYFNDNLLKTLDKRVDIIKIGRPISSINLYYLVKLMFILHRINPSIIHCHNDSLHRVIFGFKKRRIFLTVHGVKFCKDNLFAYGKLFSISNVVKDCILKTTKLDSYLVYNGVNAENIRRKTSFIKKKNSSFQIVQISRLLHQNKGQDILILALDYLVHKKQRHNIKLTFIGSGPSEIYLKELVKSKKIQSYVRFLGDVDKNQIYMSLSKYDLLIQPSRYEGFGLTVIEAMMACVPVLVSNIGGPMEIIANGKFGKYFNSENYIDCANEIDNISKGNLGIFKESSLLNARRYAIENFNVNRTAKSYLEHYRH